MLSISIKPTITTLLNRLRDRYILDMALLQQCSPQIDPIVAHAIVKAESSFNPFAIGVNSGVRIKQPQSYQQAVMQAKRLLSQGHNIDLGWGQINSKNLSWLRLSVEEAFNPCANLRAMQTIYNDCYARAGNTGAGTRMQRAFSCYNTGNFSRGFNNGYVNKLTRYYNQYQPMMAKNQSQAQPVYSLSSIPMSMPSEGGVELANYASQLQSNAQRQQDTTDYKQTSTLSDTSESVSVEQTTQQPFQATARMVKTENNSIVEQTDEIVIHTWDIFADFTKNDF